MGVITDYFRAADHDTVRSALRDASVPVVGPSGFDGVELKGHDDTVVLGMLISLIRGLRGPRSCLARG